MRIKTDNSPLIYGIGLPRTGTTSLARALNSMGIKTNHSCMLQGDTISNSRNFIQFESLVDNAFFGSYKDLAQESEKSQFILTTRCPSSWKRSIERFPSAVDFLPDIRSYEKEVTNFFKSRKAAHRLLVINIFEDDKSLQKVAEFVGITNIEGPFPHIKKENEENKK